MSWSGILAAPDPLWAAPVGIDVPAGALRDALNTLSAQAHISIAVAGKMPALRTRRVRGRMEPREALAAMLAGSGWQARSVGPDLWQLVRAPKRRTPSPAALPVASDVVGGDIVVTALKRDLQLMNTPASITVVKGAAFGRAATARGSSDLAELAGSIYTTNLGPGRDRVFLRGVADSPFNGPTQSTVGLFLDDSRINYALPDPDLRMVDVDAVEMLRGPQGTLYGAGALGGIVRIVTNRPVFDRLGGGASVEAFSTDGGAPGGAIDGYLNVPISGALAVRAVAYTDHAGGWVDDVARAKSNINHVERTGGRFDLRWRAGSDWTFDLSIAAQDLHASDTQYVTSGFLHDTALAEPHRNQFLLTRIEARGKIARLDFLSSTAIESNQFDSRFDASLVATSRALTTPLAFDEQRQVFLISQEFRLSDPHNAHRWFVGASIVDAVDLTTDTFVTASGPAFTARTKASLSLEAAVFGEATQPLGRDVDFTLGLRAYTASVFDDPRTAPKGGIDSAGFTPSTTLSWRMSPKTLVWLRGTGATRPGGRNLDGSGDLVTFKADTLRNIELGGRVTLLGGHLAIDAALFRLNWHNVQSDVIGADGLVFTANAGEAQNVGFEIDMRAKWRGFTLDTAFTQQHGRLKPADPALGEDLRLPVLPDLSGRLRLGWDGQLAGLDVGGYVSGNAWSATQLGFDPSESQRVGARAVFNAGVTLGRDRWRVALSAANLFNTRNDTFAFGNPFTLRTVAQHTPERPRTLGLRIERTF